MRRTTVTVALAAIALSANVAIAFPTCVDVNHSGNLSVADALLVLRACVGQEVEITCPLPERGAEIWVEAGAAVPLDMAGFYQEAFDCSDEEAGPSLGNTNSSHCFRQTGDSSWRIWNYGCGWTVGRMEPDAEHPGAFIFERYAFTFAGSCSTMSVEQLDTEALNGRVLLSATGELLDGVVVKLK